MDSFCQSNDNTLFVSATVYFVFILGEYIQGSGVLALVIFGVVVGSRKDQMNPETVEEIHHLYLFLSYWANCVIFILSGIYIGHLLLYIHIKPVELGVGILAYVLSLLSRGSVFLLFASVKYIIQKPKEKNYWRQCRSQEGEPRRSGLLPKPRGEP